MQVNLDFKFSEKKAGKCFSFLLEITQAPTPHMKAIRQY